MNVVSSIYHSVVGKGPNVLYFADGMKTLPTAALGSSATIVILSCVPFDTLQKAVQKLSARSANSDTGAAETGPKCCSIPKADCSKSNCTHFQLPSQFGVDVSVHGDAFH
jgi:hypothetical protein